MKTLGFDIGGANLKAADGRGRAVQVPFPLWKSPDRLADELRLLANRFEPAERIAITMTGELCDCFASKAAGVRAILASAQSAFRAAGVRVWTIDGVFRSVEHVTDRPESAAAANWLALATYVSQFASNGVLIDLGSTTCDIIPIIDGRPQPEGRSDPARLRSNELVYCGVRRTPLCAVFGLSKAAEWFATTEDVYVTLGELPERPEATDSADGRPMTKLHAAARLARMECDEGWPWSRTAAFAAEARERQARRIAESVRHAVERMPKSPEAVVVAGAGEFLVPTILRHAGLESTTTVSLRERLGPEISTAACAHAVAVLAMEEA